MKSTRLLLLLMVCFCSLAASAQTGIYAAFTGAKINSSTDWIYGPTVGVYFDRWHFGVASAGVDFRGQFLGGGGSTQYNNGLGGLRVAVTPHVLPVKPYVEAAIGVGYAKFNQSSSTNFAYNFLAGVDYTFFPRLDWRVVEFSYGGLSAFDNTFHPKTVSTGVVLRLP
ncbi:MAG TPA: hypothetical protein VM554_09220 [Acidisarcina sp.]|nr:hypothetical protein [Acidisarcina sp.]